MKTTFSTQAWTMVMKKTITRKNLHLLGNRNDLLGVGHQLQPDLHLEDKVQKVNEDLPMMMMTTMWMITNQGVEARLLLAEPHVGAHLLATLVVGRWCLSQTRLGPPSLVD
jgi:hypothetical protein